jgi:hypothetical protein
VQDTSFLFPQAARLLSIDVLLIAMSPLGGCDGQQTELASFL